jgi:cytochrome P450
VHVSNMISHSDECIIWCCPTATNLYVCSLPFQWGVSGVVIRGWDQEWLAPSKLPPVLFSPFIQPASYVHSYIPEGTAVSVNAYSIHRDSRNFFPNTDMFWPERWLIAEREKNVGFPPSTSLPSTPSVQMTRPENFIHNMDAFIPFSYGPANCVGKFLALQEMKTLVCCTLQKLDLRFADGYRAEQWLDDLKGYSLFLRGTLPVVITKRDWKEAR